MAECALTCAVKLHVVLILYALCDGVYFEEYQTESTGLISIGAGDIGYTYHFQNEKLCKTIPTVTECFCE